MNRNLVWPTTGTEMDLTLANDSYITVDGTLNNTEFFSMLEDSITETVLEDISHINLQADDDAETTLNGEEVVLPDAGTSDMVIFKSPVSEQLFSLQTMQDDDGKLQRLQFEVLECDNGQYECLPDTVQIVPLETTPFCIMQQLAKEAAEQPPELITGFVEMQQDEQQQEQALKLEQTITDENADVVQSIAEEEEEAVQLHTDILECVIEEVVLPEKQPEESSITNGAAGEQLIQVQKLENGGGHRTIALFPLPARAPRPSMRLRKYEERRSVPVLKSLNRQKPTPLLGSAPSATLPSQKENMEKKPAIKQRHSIAAKPPPAETKPKKPEPPRWNINTIIKQTTIIEAPVRHERLPRKQKIEPLDRVDEELVFQHVTVDSNGVCSPAAPRPRNAPPECVIQLSDTEDERPETIEIVDSEDEKKPTEEYACAKCEKTFPSAGSLNTHSQHHILEEANRQRATAVVARKKHRCEQCSEAFINSILLKRHIALHSARIKHECSVCKKLLGNQAQLDVHRRTAHTSALKTPPKRQPARRTTMLASKASSPKSKIPSLKIPKRRVSMAPPATPQMCNTCSSRFPTKLALEEHIINSCVKIKGRLRTPCTPNPGSASASKNRRRIPMNAGIPLTGKLTRKRKNLQSTLNAIENW